MRLKHNGKTITSRLACRATRPSVFINKSICAKPGFTVSTVATKGRKTVSVRHFMRPRSDLAVKHGEGSFVRLSGGSVGIRGCSGSDHRVPKRGSTVSAGRSFHSTGLLFARRRIGTRATHYLKYKTSIISPGGYVNYKLYAAGYRFSTVGLRERLPRYDEVIPCRSHLGFILPGVMGRSVGLGFGGGWV